MAEHGQLEALKKQLADQRFAHEQLVAEIHRKGHEDFVKQQTANEQNKRAAELEDSDDIVVKLREMGIVLNEQRIAAFLSKQAAVADVLDPIKLSVNNNQFACAIAAVYDEKKRQFLSVPSGMGKSRIIAAVITL